MQHFTRNTVEASEWCKRCHKFTMHRIDGVKLGPCLQCLNQLQREPGRAKRAPQQTEMFAPKKKT